MQNTDYANQVIEVVFGEEIPKEQVDEIMNIFSSEDLPVTLSSSVYIRLSAEELPPILVLIIVSAVSGFIGAIAKDVWDTLKHVLIGEVVPLLKKRWRKDPYVQFQFRYDDERIILHPPTESVELLEEALRKLPEYLEKRQKGSGWLFYNKDSHEWEEHIYSFYLEMT